MKKFYIFLSLFFFGLGTIALFHLIFQKKDIYEKAYEDKTNIYVNSLSRPRGRILDCNGKILVDNIGVKAIVYRKINAITTQEEIEISYQLADILKLKDEISTSELKKFWLLLHKEEGDKLITIEEQKLLEERKLTSQDLYLLKLDRITTDRLNDLEDIDKKAALIYNLMNKGYYYDAKLIKLDVTDKEYARILESKIKGITNEMYFERVYPYGETLKSIFGSVGRIRKEVEDFYLNQGYSLDDLVGTSYLELQYDNFLKGEKDTYKVNSDGTLALVSEGKRGNDLQLSIDIDMQLGIESIVKEEIKSGKKLKNTEYYHGSYVIVGNPNTGNVKAIVGLKYLGRDVFKHVESDVIHYSFTAGSIVKGASMALAYQQDVIDIGKKIKDSCVKLYLVPEKCSYKSLGYVDDITALKTSSNYYQFLLAIKMAGYKYSYNMKMDVSDGVFSLYRDAFSKFGLGVKTGIDLPNEQTGLKGNTIAPDLLLNFSIGQYDTYTPISLLQYINTIANNGVRYKLSLMDKILDNEGSPLVIQEKEILSTFDLKEKYFERIQTGFYEVLNGGTGSGYVDTALQAAGKTGTSETIFDSDLDGVGDVQTINNTFAMYAPIKEPKYSMVIISPNVSHYKGITDYFAYINRYISKAVSDYIFANF